ncbi:MAG: hypothetical protein KZQ95_07140 [Candidatus Thiodiazotropha sp. (ex Epidulcina cf. delphinae)]|nr:hypothetical protein [Candidatus Thiodiazotropha sp. (ex Epidulcina cf. delphinae)]
MSYAVDSQTHRSLLQRQTPGYLFFILILAAAWSLPLTGIANDTPTRHLLLLNSYHQSLKWDEEIYAAIKAVLRPAENNIELHVENMDTKRVPYTDAYRSQLLALLKNAYGKMRFDLIIASDNNAYDFLRTYRDELFPGVPVVFCGVNNFEPEQLQGIPAFTGVAEIFDARATVELALRLHPQTRELLVIINPATY